jgi:hypothetical protein
MSLRDSESRRALRSVIQAVSALVMLGLLAWLIYLLATEPDALLKIALSLVGILFAREVFYGGENVRRAKMSAGLSGFSAEVGEAADAVADAAADKAGEIKDA